MSCFQLVVWLVENHITPLPMFPPETTWPEAVVKQRASVSMARMILMQSALMILALMRLAPMFLAPMFLALMRLVP